MIKHNYITSNGNRLFSCYSSSDNCVNKSGILIIQPFAEEQVIMQRALYNLANDLANNDIPVCRFDLFGQGDSNGDFNNANINEWKTNILDAIDTFKQTYQLTEIILCGFRFGATLALLTTNNNSNDVHRLILIEPITHGKQYIESVLRTNLTYQMVTYGEILYTRDILIDRLRSGESINIDGYLISGELFCQICDIDLTKLTYKDKDILILNYSKNNKKVSKNLMSLCDHLRDNKCYFIRKCIPDPTAWKASELYNMNLHHTLNEIIDWINKPVNQSLTMAGNHD